MWSLNLSKVELERAIFFKNFLVVESGKIVSTSLNPTFCPDSRAVVYKSEKNVALVERETWKKEEEKKES